MTSNNVELKGAELAALKIHPLCACVPMSTSLAVRDRISVPIWMLDGMLVDGRARREEALRLGIACPVVDVTHSPEHPAIMIGRVASFRFREAYERALIARRLIGCVLNFPDWLEAHDRGFALRLRRREGRLELIEACGATLRTYQRFQCISYDALQLAVIAGRIDALAAIAASALSHDVIDHLLTLPREQHAHAIEMAIPDHKVRQPRQSTFDSLLAHIPVSSLFKLGYDLAQMPLCDAAQRWPGAAKLDDESDPSTGDEK